MGMHRTTSNTKAIGQRNRRRNEKTKGVLGMTRRKPEIILTQEVDDLMYEIVQSLTTEVGGLGYCTTDEAGNVYVDEIFLVPQQVSTGGVDFTSEAIAFGIEKAINDGRMEDLRFSWHSHGSLGCFWSSTDEGGIRDYLKHGAPWLASMVVNHDNEYRARIDIADVDPLGQITYDDLEVDVIREDRTGGLAQQMIEENVTHAPIRTWTPKKGKGGTTGQVLGGGPNSGLSSGIAGDRSADPDVVALIEAAKGTPDEYDDAEAEELMRQWFGDDADDNPGFSVIEVDTSKSDLSWTPHELQRLREAGHDVDIMSDDELLEATIKLDVQEVAPV